MGIHLLKVPAAGMPFRPLSMWAPLMSVHGEEAKHTLNFVGGHQIRLIFNT